MAHESGLYPSLLILRPQPLTQGLAQGRHEKTAVQWMRTCRRKAAYRLPRLTGFTFSGSSDPGKIPSARFSQLSSSPENISHWEHGEGSGLLTLPCDGTQVQDPGLVYDAPTAESGLRAGLQREGDKETFPQERLDEALPWKPGCPLCKSNLLPWAGTWGW